MGGGRCVAAEPLAIHREAFRWWHVGVRCGQCMLSREALVLHRSFGRHYALLPEA